jgi:hypothetical protein
VGKLSFDMVPIIDLGPRVEEKILSLQFIKINVKDETKSVKLDLFQNHFVIRFIFRKLDFVAFVQVFPDLGKKHFFFIERCLR